jgi:hypothetical protein
MNWREVKRQSTLLRRKRFARRATEDTERQSRNQRGERMEDRGWIVVRLYKEFAQAAYTLMHSSMKFEVLVQW